MEKRPRRLQVLLTPNEELAVKRRARKRGLALSTYLRGLALDDIAEAASK